MIKEYQTHPEWAGGAPGVGGLVWDGKRTINLRYVTSVRPYANDAVLISLIGEIGAFAIRAEYDHFIRDWQSVRQ